MTQYYSTSPNLYRTPEDKAACRRLKLTDEERTLYRAYQAEVMKSQGRDYFLTRAEADASYNALPEALKTITAVRPFTFI